MDGPGETHATSLQRNSHHLILPAWSVFVEKHHILQKLQKQVFKWRLLYFLLIGKSEAIQGWKWTRGKWTSEHDTLVNITCNKK